MTDEEVLRSILRRVNAPMWWARLSYPTNPKFWNEDERRVLAEVWPQTHRDGAEWPMDWRLTPR